MKRMRRKEMCVSKVFGKEMSYVGIRLLALVLLFSLLSSWTGCGKKTEMEPATENGKLNIVTTIFPQYDFARQIGGEEVDVSMLLKPGEESHSYEPTPNDIKRIQNCDLFIYVGGENDVWVEDILDSMGENKPDTLKLLDCVDTLEEEQVEGMEADGGVHEEEEEEPDEHVWTSPVNAIAIVEQMTKEFIQRDPDHEKTYQANCKAYTVQLEELDASFRKVVAEGKRTTFLFGDRFPFRYFAEEYGLSYYAAFSGCSSETEASASTVVFLIEKVREEMLPVVFTIEFSSGKIADSICEATSARNITFYSCHNVTRTQMEEGVTYLSMMKENVKSLQKALN